MNIYNVRCTYIVTRFYENQLKSFFKPFSPHHCVMFLLFRSAPVCLLLLLLRLCHTHTKKCHRQLDHTQLHRRQHLSIQTLSHITCQHTTLSHTQHCHTHTHQHCHTQLCHTHKAKLSHKTLFVTQPHSRAQICHTQVSSSFCVACMALAAVVWLGWTALVAKTPLCVTGRRGSCGTGPFWYNIVAYNFVTHNSVSYSFCGHHCVTHTQLCHS